MSQDETESQTENEFGPFGTGVTPQRYPWLHRYPHAVTFFILLFAVPVILSGWYYVYWTFLEFESPFIEVTKLPAALGSAGNEVGFRLRDRGTGLLDYEILLKQGDKEVRLTKKEFSRAKEEENVTFFINAKEHGLSEGKATVAVVARDRALKTNASTFPLELPVDLQAPSVEFLVGDTEFVSGSTALFCYRVSETTDILSGVTSGTSIFPGFPAKGLHADFAPFPNVMCVIFPVSAPGSHVNADGKQEYRIFIRDSAGNVSNIDRAAFIKPPVNSQGKAVRDLHLNTEAPTRDAIQKAEDEVLPLFARPKSQAQWSGIFRRPVGEIVWAVSDTLRIDGGGKLLEIKSPEYFFGYSERSIVPVTGDGTVSYAEELGIFGKTIIVDHGFGVTSMFTHLSGFLKREGDRVYSGGDLAAAGSTGIAPESGFGYSIRVHGVPVRANDWVDNGLYTRFFDARIKELRRLLGIREIRILD